MNIAWLTPFSHRSGIGHFSAIVVAELRARANVAVFASDFARGDTPVNSIPDLDVRGMIGVSHERLLAELAGFDLCIYQLGDNLEFHGAIFDLAQELPGITVLHDLVMHHFFAGYHLMRHNDPHGYITEAVFCHGAAGEEHARAVLAGTAPDLSRDPDLLRFNMAKSAIHRSDGVIVHSKFALQSVLAIAESPVVHIPFPTPDLSLLADQPAAPRVSARGKIRLMTYGVVNPNKLIAEVVTALAGSPFLRRRVVYDVVGSLSDEVYAAQLRQLIAETGLQDRVFLRGFREEKELRSALASADLVINLRKPHFGESSWSLLQASFAGKPSLVWKHGYYDEFPDDAVAKVSRIAEIGPQLEALGRDAELRLELGKRARAFAERTFSTTQYCDHLLAFAERTRHNRPVLRLADTVARGLRELGQPAGSATTALALAEIVALSTDDGEPGAKVRATGRRRRHGS